MNEPIRIILVEDHAAYREVIELALADEPDIELLATFGAAEVALRKMEKSATHQQVDVLLLDIRLPKMSGVDALPWFKEYSPNTKIIMLTQSKMEADVIKAIQSGAAGYLLKSSSIETIVEGIRSVMAGETALDNTVAKYLVQQLKKQQVAPSLNIDLTERETEILTLIAEGLVKKEIAAQLGIGHETIVEHVKRIYVKLEVKNAPAAINRAHRLGLLQDDPES